MWHHFLWKWKLYDLAFKKRLVYHYLKQNNSDLAVFQTRTIFSKKFVAGHVIKMSTFFKNMNYLFLNRNLALKLQGNCWKDDVVTFTARLSVTIKRLTRYKQKVVLAAMLDGKSMLSNVTANTNHNTLLKKSKWHKISSLNAFALKFWV